MNDVVTIAALVIATAAVGLLLLRERRSRRTEDRVRAEMEVRLAGRTEVNLSHPPLADRVPAMTESDGPSSTRLGPLPSRGPVRPPDELVDLLAAGECVLFAGSGLVAQTGYPTFRQMLESVVELYADEFAGNVYDALIEQLESGEPELAGESIRARIGDEAFRDALRRHLARIEPRTSAAMVDLQRLPFAGIVTDDWSGEIARRFYAPTSVMLTPTDHKGGADVLRGERRFIVEAYGSVERGTLLIGSDDYRASLQANPAYARVLGTILTTRSILFVGTSVEGVEEFMRSAEVPPGAHFALVPRSSRILLDADRLRRRHGVELLVYEPDETHSAVPAFTTELRHRVPVAARGPVPPSIEAETVSEVRLRNIGPFADLTVPLGEARTIILGDNGSGKSSVLRAIALALAGESPETARLARRMLKADERQGSVELRVGRARYTSSLVADAGRVLVRAPQLTPVQAGAWLAVGFPPLRGISIAAPKGPTAETLRDPVPDDLLPVLSDRPDDRLDGLKQWLINTALRAEDEERERRKLDRFFEVLRALTPGVEFEFSGVDRSDWSINLQSPVDGPLSFDLLSRGMMTILGWIGVLLQRLYETHPADPVPEQRRALLLVDEIDVHLHPEWQRRILPLLEEHFPRLQIIATTHSPLVVGSARPGEVLHLRDDRTLIRVDENFSGWRSDQILTSEAFELETTRDTATEAVQREYRDLLARGQTPSRSARAAELAQRLTTSRGDEETETEREAADLFREWLEARLTDSPEADRAELAGAAEAYLARLRRGG